MYVAAAALSAQSTILEIRDGARSTFQGRKAYSTVPRRLVLTQLVRRRNVACIFMVIVVRSNVIVIIITFVGQNFILFCPSSFVINFTPFTGNYKEFIKVTVNNCLFYVINHDYKNIFLFSDYTFIKSRLGKQLILYNDYTFWHYKHFPTKGTHHWLCTASRSKDCRAKLILDRDNKIFLGNQHHNHEPPQYYISNGEYYRIYSNDRT